MSTFQTRQGLDERLREWLRRCQAIVDHYMAIQFPLNPKHTLEIAGGTRYIKIQETFPNPPSPQNARRAWAFIDVTTGDILKPKTWKQPAKHPRGNIFDDDYGMKNVGPYGPNYMGQAPYAKLPNAPY